MITSPLDMTIIKTDSTQVKWEDVGSAYFTFLEADLTLLPVPKDTEWPPKIIKNMSQVVSLQIDRNQ